MLYPFSEVNFGWDTTYEVEVPARTLSSLLDEARIGAVDFLSLDVEGLEIEVLEGLDLSRHRPAFLLVEFWTEERLARIGAILGQDYELVERITDHDAFFRRLEGTAPGRADERMAHAGRDRAVRHTSGAVIARLRHFLSSSSGAAINASGVRTRGIYSAVGELARRYEISPLDLTPFELKAFSQNGEDGVIQEVLRRIGFGSRTFAEFGVGTGAEGNCVFLAHVLGWHGVFLEADVGAHARLARRYEHVAGVSTVNAYVQPDTIDELLPRCGVDPEPAVLSIDVDGNDYHLWERLESVRPRLLVIEYNAALDPRAEQVQPYSPAGPDGTAFFGASLGALEALGRRKGYRLVHTELAGVNAFFVREDLAGDAFLALDEVPRRPANYYLDDMTMHTPPDPRRTYITP